MSETKKKQHTRLRLAHKNDKNRGYESHKTSKLPSIKTTYAISITAIHSFSIESPNVNVCANEIVLSIKLKMKKKSQTHSLYFRSDKFDAVLWLQRNQKFINRLKTLISLTADILVAQFSATVLPH